MEHLGLFRSYLSHLNSKLCAVFFMDSLFSKEYSVKILIFFSTDTIGWKLVQLVHQASLYRALILVILEPKSYMAWAHKLQIGLGKYFRSILGLGLGSLQPTLNPYGFLVVKQGSKYGERSSPRDCEECLWGWFSRLMGAFSIAK